MLFSRLERLTTISDADALVGVRNSHRGSGEKAPGLGLAGKVRRDHILYL